MQEDIIKHPIFGEFSQGIDALKILVDFVKNPRGFLLLAGPNGTGKTHAARAIFHRHDYNNYHDDKAFFITQADLNDFWKKTALGHVFSIDHVEVCKTTGLLVLDDIGTRKPSDAFMDALYTIADRRKTNELPTIITTNLNSQSMREQFGDAFVSRIASGKCIRFKGPDRRFNEF